MEINGLRDDQCPEELVLLFNIMDYMFKSRGLFSKAECKLHTQTLTSAVAEFQFMLASR